MASFLDPISRVTHGFPKREFNELLLSGNATGSSDETHEPVHER